jgi:hypothetical protein
MDKNTIDLKVIAEKYGFGWLLDPQDEHRHAEQLTAFAYDVAKRAAAEIWRWAGEIKMDTLLPNARLKELLGVIFCLALFGCNTGPSCEESGGKLEFSHFIIIYQPALKMNQIYPQYKCVMPYKCETPNAELRREP